ncbi:hypothetical protein D8674_028921 [Pyrus ussuriensis x Pyrus communis]|uniref:Uncharacterized protein n=1 Tax=Pyrus ussuriensis x Pyrus communis TaxID=2448454 RepID=A0A5N5IB46_9ROSA|nr:hypothetical protein D8674_028921 [Pyrus ussuriensis x Pyrus communis]
METVKVTPIAELCAYTKANKIKIRNNAVEICASDIHCELVASKIDAGNCYEIVNFRTIRIRGPYKVVPHDTQVIFIATTVIAQKCDIYIENIRKEELSVTLFVNIAEVFCSLSIQKLSLPIVVVIGYSLFFIDRDILEVNSYKLVFSTCKVPVKILPPSLSQANGAEILRTARRVTIDELAFLDPNLYKNDTFLCKASVKRFDTHYDWWYNAYPNCVKQMHKDPATGQLICQKHPNQIPTPCEAEEISKVDPKEFDEMPIKSLEKKNRLQLLQKQIQSLQK